MFSNVANAMGGSIGGGRGGGGVPNLPVPAGQFFPPVPIGGGGAGGAVGPAMRQSINFPEGALGTAIKLTAITAVIAAAAFALYELGKAAVHFAGVASPATARRFSMAWEDVQGVIGRTMIPIVEHLTTAFRLLGDFLASILPSTAEMREALSPLKEIFNTIRTELQVLAPIFKELFIININAWRIGLEALNLAMKASPLYWLGKLAPNLESSVGAAARPARFSDVVEYGRQAYISALSSSGGADPARKTAENTSSIKDMVEAIVTYLTPEYGAPGTANRRLQ